LNRLKFGTRTLNRIEAKNCKKMIFQKLRFSKHNNRNDHNSKNTLNVHWPPMSFIQRFSPTNLVVTSCSQCLPRSSQAMWCLRRAEGLHLTILSVPKRSQILLIRQIRQSKFGPMAEIFRRRKKKLMKFIKSACS